MINGIIKLFYSEVVKTRMRKLPSYSEEAYQLKDEGKKIRDVAVKIDSLSVKLLKITIGLIILWLAFDINIILGVGTLLVGLLYMVYKKNLEIQTKQYIQGVKSNINSLDIPKAAIMTQKSKVSINTLITLLIIGLIAGFNPPIVICFVVVFMFTIRDIYSKIK